MSERELVCADLNVALESLRGAGLRLDLIYPADEPHTAILSKAGETVRVTSRPDAPRPSDDLPDFRPEFVITHDADHAGEGRAGMFYRDLIPGRLGGRYIASHIKIPAGGPVADWVHFHRVAFQMISVRKGWVRVVYEDQGEPFVMQPGDVVLQPPGIRHRVLESSSSVEVIEIGCPAVHETRADHDLALPNRPSNPARLFGGQRFAHHVAAQSPWTPVNGAEAQETVMYEATGGRAEVRFLRARANSGAESVIDIPPNDGELDFGFILAGSARLDHAGAHFLRSGDSFVIPPGEGWRLSDLSGDLRLLHVVTGRFG